VIPDGIRHNAHMYYILAFDAQTRTRVLAELKSEGIGGLFHYVPLHSAPAGERFGRAHGALTVTDDLSARLIRLPMFYEMTEHDVDRVCEILESAITAP
jgi:dTDP-4-amino-4,6-dideoxygalactose transaminase